MQASVVVPTYERPDRLVATIETVCDQSVDDYEIIVVDDGSESAEQREALERVRALHDRITVLEIDNGGPAAARNVGWRESRADIVLFTDDDCLVPFDWIERLTDAFEDRIGAVGGPLVPTEEALENSIFASYHLYRDKTTYNRPDEPTVGGADLAMGGTANIAYRREALDDVEGFDETFPTAAGEDADLQKRVVDAGWKMKFVPTAVRHNDRYDRSTFVSRALRRGAGTHHYHSRHGPRRSTGRVLVGLLGSVLVFGTAIRHSRSPAIGALAVAERGLMRYGELREMVTG